MKIIIIISIMIFLNDQCVFNGHGDSLEIYYKIFRTLISH
jgi:hypothetical protein